MRRPVAPMAPAMSACSAVGGGRVSRSASASPASEASGVRRSCEIAASSVLRSRSPSICTALSRATSM
jgi:hypothetical protein